MPFKTFDYESIYSHLQLQGVYLNSVKDFPENSIPDIFVQNSRKIFKTFFDAIS